MDTKYNPKNIEEMIYKNWEQHNYFQPTKNKHKKNYCIVMPPPNITGPLHLGHAFQHTIMDIIIRYQRMQGKNTLWQPGMDHAGIATQILVEQFINNNENKTKNNYGKTNFIKKTWKWQSKYINTIKYQMKRLGLSANWQQERYTLDQEMSTAVQEVFIQLYQNNLIYRGKRLVNWDPKIQTAISDLEIEIKKTQGTMWYLRYPFSNTKNKKNITHLNYLIVATTRPETIFGDVAIAINPNDSRYQNLLEKYVYVPITQRKIPIIFDTHIDINKGTGCTRITPAHDFNDYEIAKHHKLPIINILTPEGKIHYQEEIFDSYTNTQILNKTKNYIPKKFHNIDRFIARSMVIEECNKLHLLEKKENYTITTPCNNRNGEPIEPMLTDQWFIRTHILSKIAIDAVKHEKIQFIPKQYKNVYFQWMKNVQDWCISRQIWWGHNIPAWYDNNNKIYVGRNEQEIRKKNKISKETKLHKDKDVLDTWFSSGLWTFASLGWPKNIKKLNKFHPTDVIVSGFDIIFFWIARMIMLTMHLIKDKNNQPEIPFKKIFITGLILDETGKKMSKSKGNIIDPIDLIEGISIENLLKKRITNMMQPKLSETIKQNTQKKFPNGISAHGADSVRFTLTALACTGKNIHWDMKRLSGYHNFCNKLWHAGQFILINTQNEKYHELLKNNKKILSTQDRWILTKLQETIKIFRESLNNYRFDTAANILYTFTWYQFCNWYIEFSKITIYHKNQSIIYGTYYTLLTVLETLLRLAHPIIPFITEAIWQKIKLIFEHKNSIMIQPFPHYNKSMIDIHSITDIEWIKKLIINIRNIRNNMNITARTPLTLCFQNTSHQIQERIKNNIHLLKITNITHVDFLKKNEKYENSIITFIENTKIFIPISNNINIKINELQKISQKLKNIDEKIIYITNKIKNKDFVNNAPTFIIKQKENELNNLKKLKIELLNQKTIYSSIQ